MLYQYTGNELQVILNSSFYEDIDDVIQVNVCQLDYKLIHDFGSETGLLWRKSQKF